jgi:methionyl-tRNA formyltransferase
MVSMPKESLPDNSIDLSSFADSVDAAYLEFADINSADSIAALGSYDPDYLLVSWPRILKPETLVVPRYFCIGTHPTALPQNRGRHPLHWTLALGIRETQLSFFRLDEAVDTGDILLQVPLPAFESDSIQDLVERTADIGYEGARRLYKMLVAEPDFSGVTQHHGAANTWRKRTPHDVTLDPRMSAGAIVRTVRSFAPPYPGAIMRFNEHEVRIARASIVSHPSAPDGSLELRQMEPGKVISAYGRLFKIKAEDAIVELEAIDNLPDRLLKAKYIHPPTRYISDAGIHHGPR